MGARKDAAREMSYFDLLQQDRWWRQADGSMIKIERMDQAHRLSVLSTLERKSHTVGQWRAMSLIRESYQMAMGPQPSGEMASDAFDSILDDLSREADAWRVYYYPMMRRTPLYRALLELCVKVTNDSQPGGRLDHG